jgi:hypothetical protein
MTTTGTILEAFDNAFQKWGRAAPPARADEDANSYTRRVARIAQRKNYLSYDEPVKKVNFAELPDHALPQFRQLLIEGIKRSVMRPDTVPDGEERQVFTRDENTGMAIRSFVRPDGQSFVKDMGQPCRKVVSIKAKDQILYQAAGSRQWR